MTLCVRGASWGVEPVAAEGSLSSRGREGGWSEVDKDCSWERERDKEGGGRLTLSFLVWGRRGED